jgi:cell division protein ZapE
LGIRAAWEKSLQLEGHVRDNGQAALVIELERLQSRLQKSTAQKSGWLSRFWSEPEPPVRGLYIWGGVGRGKTFLMDLFFETLELRQKKRIHFHRMMHTVHARLGELADVPDPLEIVAADIARDTRVLCFDEFFVSDIGDAMILSRLLRGLFLHRVTLLATSNSRPEDLYKDGLQRSQFMPAIELINQHMGVFHLDSATDYRLRLLEKAGTYLTPDDAAAEARMARLFHDSASSDIRFDTQVEVNGRPIAARASARSIAWFDFDALCDGPRSQADYIELARWYPTVLLSGVPQFTAAQSDQARRFIALVDEFYDRRVKLILTAACSVPELYAGKRLAFEFERTASRLIEMQSSAYLVLEHLA